MNDPNKKCFACGKRLKDEVHLVDTRDDQTVFVGPECFRYVRKAGEMGFQLKLGGLRLYPMRAGKGE